MLVFLQLEVCTNISQDYSCTMITCILLSWRISSRWWYRRNRIRFRRHPPERWGKGGAVRGGRLVTGVMVLGGVSLLRGATGGAAGSVAEWEVGAECCMPLVRAVLCSTGGWEVRVGSEEGGMTGGRLWRIPEALPERCRCQLPWSGGGIGGRELKLIGAEPGIGGGRLGKSIREERLNKAQA